MQGATVDRAHLIADGGGRELAYVAMSRARDTSKVYVAADDLDQAVDDLRREWSLDRRQRWILDVDEPAGVEREQHPALTRRPDEPLRIARLKAERDALRAVAPGADERLRALDRQLRLAAVGLEPSDRSARLQRGRGLA